MYAVHYSSLNHVDLSASWTTLSRLAKQRRPEGSWLQLHAGMLDLLVQHTVRVAKEGKIGARQLANVAYALQGLTTTMSAFANVD